MSKEKLGQETEFPVTENIGSNGMSKRFYAACATLTGILANPNSTIQRDGSFHTYESLAETAYLAADELLKQESL